MTRKRGDRRLERTEREAMTRTLNVPQLSADPRPAFEALCRCLDQLLSVQTELCSSGEAKRDALVHLRAADVERTTATEHALLESVAGIDLQRSVLTAQLARHHRLEPQGLRLGALLKHAPEPYASRLGGLRHALQESAERLTRLNRLNAALATQSIQHTETMLRLITGGGGGTSTYTRTGGLAERPAAPRAIVDRVA